MPKPLTPPPSRDDPGFDRWLIDFYNAVKNLQGVEIPTQYLSQAEAVDLTDRGETVLHYHASDRARANHTGTQTSATISDLEAFVRSLLSNSDHAGLANLSWLVSGHTGTATTVAGFNSSGVAEVLTRSGTGTVVALQTGASLLTPTINTVASVGGAWTAAATWTLPAHTLGGTVTINGQTFSGAAVFNAAVSGITDLTTTGNTILGNAQADTLNVGNGDIIKNSSGQTGFGTTPSTKVHVMTNSSNGSIVEELRIDGGTQNTTVSGSGQLISFCGVSTTYYGAFGGYGNGSVGGAAIWTATASGTPSVFIQSGGHFGIGTVTPNADSLNGGPNFRVQGTGPSIQINDTTSGGKYALLAHTGISTNQFRIYDFAVSADRLTISSTGAVSIPGGLTVTGNIGATDITASGVLSGGSITTAGLLNAGSNVVLGGAIGDTLTIAPNAVTWSNAPTHSNNHTFTGNLSINGNTTIGDASGDTLTIAPNAVTWSNAPTHSNSHTFTNAVTSAAFKPTSSTIPTNGLYLAAANTLGLAANTASVLQMTSTLAAFLADITGSGYIRSTGPGSGIGYATGAGGTVTQATNKSTGVTLSKACGEITMDGATLNAATIVSFTLTNTTIAATDVLVLNHVTTGTKGAYTLNAECLGGSATISVRNNTAGNLAEAIVIRFAVIKGVTS